MAEHVICVQAKNANLTVYGINDLNWSKQPNAEHQRGYQKVLNDYILFNRIYCHKQFYSF
jgi:hypothetical protein